MSANEYFYDPLVSKGETLLVTIDGNFLDPILKENIDFYRNDVKIPMDYEITKIDDYYYIYAIISDQSQTGNYSLRINDVDYYKGSQIVNDEIRLNYTVLDDVADFSINKGFVSTNQDFSITVQNLNEGRIQIEINEEVINGDLNPLEYSYDDIFNNSNVLILKSGETRTINFDTSSIMQTTLRNLIFSSAQTSYSIPFFMYANKTDVKPPILSRNFKLSPDNLNFTTSTKNKRTDYIYITNIGNERIEDIKIILSDSITPYMKLSSDSLYKLDEGSEYKLELYTQSQIETSIEGEIIVSTPNETLSLPVKVSFVEGYIPPIENITNGTNNSGNGNTGNGNGNNNGGNNTGTEKPFSYTKAIGWFLLVAVILFLLWFYLKKYKRTKKKVDILDIGEKGGLPRKSYNELDLKKRPKL